MRIGHVLLFLTYRCNLRCDFCLSFNSYWRADAAVPLPPAIEPRAFLRAARETREMSTTDIVERIIPQCEANGVEAIALSGGEVLVRRDAPEIFRALGRSTMRWCFDSNLMLCDEALAATIVQSRCDRVYVSLDGPPDTHNRLRGSPKAFQKALRGLRGLEAARRAFSASTAITVNCVLQPGNEDVPPAMVDVALDCGADELTFQLLSERVYRLPFDSRSAASALERALALARCAGLKAAVYPLTDPNEESLKSWFSMPLSSRFFGGCTYIHESLRIDPLGNVIPCLEYRMGNILKEDLGDIWTGASYRAFREHLARSGPFEACLRCCNMTMSRASA